MGLAGKICGKSFMDIFPLAGSSQGPAMWCILEEDRDKLVEKCREAQDKGFSYFKLKLFGDVKKDADLVRSRPPRQRALVRRPGNASPGLIARSVPLAATVAFTPFLSADMLEALYLAKWYAREHVLLCLIQAFFIASAISVSKLKGASQSVYCTTGKRVNMRTTSIPIAIAPPLLFILLPTDISHVHAIHQVPYQLPDLWYYPQQVRGL